MSMTLDPTSAKDSVNAVLTPLQVARFRSEGFLQVNSFAHPEEVASIRRVLAAMFENRTGFAEGAQFDLVAADGAAGEARFPQIVNPHHFAKELRGTAYFDRAFGLAKQLLGPRARFSDDHVLMKPAVDGPETPWHQDEAFRDPKYLHQEISIWLALQAVDDVNGCMTFIPRSNHGPVLPHRPLGNDPTVHALECYEGFDAAGAIACPLPAGGCTVHDGRTLHYAGPNRSAAPRYAYVLIFNLPPSPMIEEREFPWLAARATLREAREKAWRRRGGVLVQGWRWARKLNLRDRGALAADLQRALSATAKAFRRR